LKEVDQRPFKTAVSDVREGVVLIRGYSHEEIMRRLPYASATYLTLIGRLPTENEARLTDAILTSLLDHGFVAATVSSARYIASGNPQVVPAVAGGLLAAGQNTLSPEHAYELIAHAQELRSANGWSVAEAAAAVVDEVLAEGRRFPGFGHPVHRSGDFRAEVLFGLAEELGLSGEATAMYRAIHERFLEKTKRSGIPINIDGCLACLGMDMGFTAHQTVGLALLAVLPGLIAHVIEEIDSAVALRWIDGEYVGADERQLPADGAGVGR
jgi:citrate synthase